jgi:hypothetical protein
MAAESNLSRPGSVFPAHMREPLRARGFVREGHVYKAGDLTLAASGRWFVLSDESGGSPETFSSGGVGAPGLWKWVQNHVPPHRIFEIPKWTVSDEPDSDRLDQSGPAPLLSLLDWAMATRSGRVPTDWALPEAGLARSWLPQGALTVQSKGCVRQGELLLRPGCWALRIPILLHLAGNLPEPRLRALAELAVDAQRRWAMVRLGFTAEAAPGALVAEVNFTGAPHSELLFSAGLDVLRQIVAWLVETADVLGDPSIAIASLAEGGDKNPSRERKTP